MTAGANATTDAAYPTACKWCRAELIDESPTWLLFACNSGFFRKRAGEDAAWERDEKCWSAEIAALHARIAELEKQLQTWKELYEAAATRNALLGVGVKALRDKYGSSVVGGLKLIEPWVIANQLTDLLGQEGE